MNKTVSGCIVTYNNMSTIDSAISSLLQFTAAPFTLYVVDNGSTDGTIEHIEKNYPQVKLIKSPGNIGFGAGHNLILDKLDSDYHVIINPDISIKDDVIAKMIEYLEGEPEIGMLSPQIKFPNGNPQILGKKIPTLRYLFASHFRPEGEPGETLKEYAMLDQDLSKPIKIENASGCFMFIRTELFKKLGGFDKRYFMYFEDCDLTRQVNEISSVIYYPETTVYHEWGHGSKKKIKLKLIHINSMLKYFIKWGVR